jgi:N-acetylneuraminic acid mutarotase
MFLSRLPLCAGSLEDMYVYDPATMTWTDLSKAAAGVPPAGRYGQAFIEAGGLLYVHGGWNGAGDWRMIESFAVVVWRAIWCMAW